MTFEDYQKAAHATAVYPPEIALSYLSLGLVGEAGEVANKVKKIYRDYGGKCDPGMAAEIVYELGDVLWYLSELANHLGWDLEQVAIVNRDKLRQRKVLDTIKGSGDNR